MNDKTAFSISNGKMHRSLEWHLNVEPLMPWAVEYFSSSCWIGFLKLSFRETVTAAAALAADNSGMENVCVGQWDGLKVALAAEGMVGG